MVATRRGDHNHSPKNSEVHYTRSTSMSKRVRPPVTYRENEDSNDESEFLSFKRRRTRSSSTKAVEDPNSPVAQNGNSEDEFPSRRYNGNSAGRSSPSRRMSSDDHKYQSSLRHPQIDADLMKKKTRDTISHSRSLRSLGLEEEGSSCEEEDGIGALATSLRPRTSSRETFPNMLLRRSSRKKKTIYSTLNVSTIEHAAMLPEELEVKHVEHVTRQRSDKSRSIKPELRDLLIAQGKNPEDFVEHSQPDIYSSIKSRRRLRRPRRFFDEDDIGAGQNAHDHSDNSEHEQPAQEGEKDEDEEIEENEDEEEDDDDEDEEEEVVTRRKYSLRTKRAQPLRLVYEIKRKPRQTPRDIFDHLPASPMHRRKRHVSEPQHHASPYQQRQRRTNSQGASSTSTTSDEDDDEEKFQRRKKKSMAKARNRCLPMNLTLNELAQHGFANERRKIGSSLADVDPMNVDKTVKFSSVGGHKKHIRALKEMVVFPLMYPEVFAKFHINPPRGCLFYGPPGTGKTLMARALANECSAEGKKVAFFMRKGADCLSKWVGESERQLRLLFDQAYQMRPSIIFFDEIDGLAPVRSTRQDQIHSSIVSTLLGLMDGLDNRGEIVVIGATNRIDSIDPALRRPGRFDREFHFPLPDKKARRDILKIHTQKWESPPTEAYLDCLAEKTVGYCGADIMALCAESAFVALRRRYPQIYNSDEKLKLDVNSINIQASDFCKAMKNVIPAAQRSDASPGQALRPSIRPLLFNMLRSAITQLSKAFPLILKKSKVLRVDIPSGHGQASSDCSVMSDSDSDFEDEHHGILPLPFNGLTLPQSSLGGMSSFSYRESAVYRPRMLLCGHPSDGQTTHLAPALLHDIEGVPVHLLDIPALYGTSARTPEEACAQIFREARRTSPSIIYIPNAPMWWDSASPTVHHTFEALLNTLPASSPVALIGTADCTRENIPEELSAIFHRDSYDIFVMRISTDEERSAYFAPIFLQFAVKPPVNKLRRQIQSMEILEKAPAPQMAELTEKELEKIELQEEATMRNLRLFLRDILTRLAQDRRFKVFLKPVDTEEVPDYTEVIEEPMDISTMMGKIDQHKYNNVASFVRDIGLICSNALEYNPDHCAEDRAIRHRACLLKDIAHAIIQDDLDPNFERLCNEVIEARKRRNANPLKFAPNYFNVLPKNRKASHGEKAATEGAEPCKTAHFVKSEDVNTGRPSHANQHRKKRRRSTWASGVIRKPKKKTRIEDDSDGDTNGNNEIAVDDGGLDSADDSYDSHTKVNDDGEEQQEDVRHDSGDAVAKDEASPPEGEVLHKMGPAGDADSTMEVVEDLGVETNHTPDHVTENAELNCVFQDEEKDPCVDEELLSDKADSASTTSLKRSDSNHSTSSLGKSSSANGEAEDQQQQSFHLEVHEDHIKEADENLDHDEKIGPDQLESTPEKQNQEEGLVPENDSSNQKTCRMTLRPRMRSQKDEDLSHPTPIVLPPSPPLIVDEQKLKDLLHLTVQKTASLRVEELERLYSVLVRCVYRHRHKYDKTSLIQELTAEVTSYVSHVGMT